MRAASQRLAIVAAAARMPTVPKFRSGSPAPPATIIPPSVAPTPLATCCTAVLAEMLLPRRRGSMLDKG